MSRMRLKFAFDKPVGGVWGEEPQGDINDIVCVRVADFDDEAGKISADKLTIRNISQAEQEGRILRPGDLLLEKSGGGDQTLVGRCVRFDHDTTAVCSNFIALLRPKKGYDANFLYYLLSSSYQGGGSFPHIKQTTGIQNLDCDSYLSGSVDLPPVAEQTRIAAYLDEVTDEAGHLTKLRKQQMELMRERKISLIQNTVTRGLNPAVLLKDSGIPWLGSVPTHWEVKRNKFIFREIDLRSSDGSEELLTVSHITGVTPRSHKDEVNMFLAESNEGYKRVEVGDIAINTMWAWMGALGFSKYRGIVSPSYNVYRFRHVACAEYYDLLFRSPQFIKEIIRHSTGVWDSRLRLYPDAFFEIRSPMPPLDEQEAIVAYIEKMTGQTEAILSAYIRQLELLTGYRAALIHDYVTGQRTVTRRIPESMCLAVG